MRHTWLSTEVIGQQVPVYMCPQVPSPCIFERIRGCWSGKACRTWYQKLGMTRYLKAGRLYVRHTWFSTWVIGGPVRAPNGSVRPGNRPGTYGDLLLGPVRAPNGSVRPGNRPGTYGDLQLAPVRGPNGSVRPGNRPRYLRRPTVRPCTSLYCTVQHSPVPTVNQPRYTYGGGPILLGTVRWPLPTTVPRVPNMHPSIP